MIADGSDVYFQRDPFELSRAHPDAQLIFFGDRGDDPSGAASSVRVMGLTWRDEACRRAPRETETCSSARAYARPRG